MTESKRRIGKKELKVILKNHVHFLEEDCEGRVRMQADLSFADLSRADLEDVDLTDAILRYADLSGANLVTANLAGADLHKANLTRANLMFATLAGANLSYANLTGADLTGAIMDNADLTEAVGIESTCPSQGSFIGWKCCIDEREKDSGMYYPAIVKLEIPADARRVTCGGSRMCRAEWVKVLAIYDKDGELIDKATAMANRGYRYIAGEVACPDKYTEDRWSTDRHGINFFITRDEAVRWAGAMPLFFETTIK